MECHSVDCSGDSKVLTELPDSNKIEDIVFCTITRYCKYTRECGHGEMRNK